METTIQPAGSGAGEGLDFTKSDGSGINKKPMRESDAWEMILNSVGGCP